MYVVCCESPYHDLFSYVTGEVVSFSEAKHCNLRHVLPTTTVETLHLPSKRRSGVKNVADESGSNELALAEGHYIGFALTALQSSLLCVF